MKPSPTPAEIRQARLEAGLTQAQAAELVALSHQPRWAEYEAGVKLMPAARWELFQLKARHIRK